MTVKVRFFAALRERVGAGEVSVDAGDGLDVGEVWRRATDLPMDAHVLVAVNKSYATPDAVVADGDEVAFFPPVTGG
ncbi:MAG: MoaD/ThiS family protein [Proteobacteria bacterium]|nr:MAG: MoaD/ThiS family protein [Pseudomonadota bacterium]